METGEFDPPSDVAYTQISKSVIQSPAHQALAEEVAANDLVLLKNDDVAGTSAPLLPADPATLSSVVIVGNLAGTVTLGDYSGDPSLQVSAVQGITSAVRRRTPAPRSPTTRAGPPRPRPARRAARRAPSPRSSRPAWSSWWPGRT
jgi:beta-glucosidase-like glycosyl hydrolase